MLSFKLIQKIKKKFFPFYKNSDLRFVFKKLQEDHIGKDVTARFVGGCVRKYLSNEEVDDIDVATSLTPTQVKEKFKDTKFNIIDTGLKHGTVTLVFNKLKLEITTLRKDVKTDGRHAEIEYTNDWQEDSNRRDFTINAIYLDIKGKIFDPQLGTKDLKNNIVKFIGDPNKRIEEDYLRIIRFIRFSLEYQNKIEKSTVEALKLNLNGIKKISKERILLELFKILKLKNIIQINHNDTLKELFLLIFPELKYLERLSKLNKIFQELFVEKDILLAILLIDEKNNQEYFSHKYKISNDLKDKLNMWSQNFIKSQENKNFFHKDLKKNIFYFGKEHIQSLNLINFSINKKNKSEDYRSLSAAIKKTILPKFPFDGNYIKNKGINEGVVIGKILNLLQEEWLNNNFKISDKKVLKIISDQKN